MKYIFILLMILASVLSGFGVGYMTLREYPAATALFLGALVVLVLAIFCKLDVKKAGTNGKRD